VRVAVVSYIAKTLGSVKYLMVLVAHNLKFIGNYYRYNSVEEMAILRSRLLTKTYGLLTFVLIYLCINAAKSLVLDRLKESALDI